MRDEELDKKMAAIIERLKARALPDLPDWIQAEPPAEIDYFPQARDIWGQPVFVTPTKDGPKVKALNERFWAGLLAKEKILIYEPDEKAFYKYDRRRGLYVEVTEPAIRDMFTNRIVLATKMRGDIPKGLEEFTSARILTGPIHHLRGVAEDRPFNNPEACFIHCQNCVLTLNGDGSFEPKRFSPEFKSRNQSPIPYVPEAKCERFENEVLGWIRDEDKEIIQKMFGSMLLGYKITQKVLLLHGLGGTGKSTLALILQGIVGSQNISELRTAHLDDRFEIARYLGKSLLIGVNVKADFLSGSAVSRLKGLVGGDFLDAERKNSNSNFRLHGRFNVLITSNSRLRVKLEGDQSAWRRRLVLIEYDVERSTKTIRDFDKVILKEEAPGILLWGLAGLAKLKADLSEHGDLFLSERQYSIIENVLEESDSLRIFLKRQIVQTDGHDLTVGEIASAYMGFCVEQHWTPIPPGRVHKDLEPLMLEYFGTAQSTSIQREGKAARGFRKVRFRQPDED
jgi:putative DNA primase/helicase